MSNVVSMESKLEALERELDRAAWSQEKAMERLVLAIANLDGANIRLAKAMEAMEKLV